MNNLGSPPHTWRKPLSLANQFLDFRITSTYVEKTRAWTSYPHGWRDHLHIRGENVFVVISGTSGTGSPPHTWRKPFLFIKRWSWWGITSTYVEKTKANAKMPVSKQDHLHIRGENSTMLTSRTPCTGSPPHTWRKPDWVKSFSYLHRITSTYVEKTYC